MYSLDHPCATHRTFAMWIVVHIQCENYASINNYLSYRYFNNSNKKYEYSKHNKLQQLQKNVSPLRTWMENCITLWKFAIDRENRRWLLVFRILIKKKQRFILFGDVLKQDIIWLVSNCSVNELIHWFVWDTNLHISRWTNLTKTSSFCAHFYP